MLKKIRYILLTIFVTFAFLNNVFADASFDAAGNIASGASGGSVHGTSSGFSLLLSPMLKFTLVDISDSNKLVVKSTNYMINTTGTYDDYLKNNNLEGSMNVRGYIDSSGNYSTEVLNVADKIFQDSVHFERSTMQNIIPNKSGAFLNFSVENLKNTVCNFDSNGKCNITAAYEKVVLYMLSEAGISISSLSSMDNDTKTKIVNYRIIIEPIYVFKYGSKYRFSTIKAMGGIGAGVNTSGANPYFGVYVKQLYYNTYASQRHGSINAASFKFCEETSASAVVNCYKNLADTNNGAGYAIFQLSYDIPNTCKIEKNGNGDFLFYNKEGTAFNNNLDNSNGGTPGSNFEYLIDKSQCGCEVVNNSTFKSELLNNSIIQNIYNSNCTTPQNACTYVLDGTNYRFYDNKGQSVSDYLTFVKKCGCNHTNVSRLKNFFPGVYNAECEFTEDITPNGNLGVCTLDNEDDNIVSITKTKKVNNYCKRTCVEKIDIDNLLNTSSLTYRAGQYFELDRYPSLTATKKCTLDFNYKLSAGFDWYDDYKNALKNMVDAYKNWKYYDSIDVNNVYCNPCSYPNSCPSTRPTYSYSYSYFKRNADGLTLSIDSDSGGWSDSCGATADNYGDDAAFWKAKYEEYAITIASLKSSMEACNVAIDFEGNDFYNFENELEFHYQQDIIENNKVSSIWNEDRYIDDSKMQSNLISSSNSCSGVQSGLSCTFSAFHLYDDISNGSIEKNDSKITKSITLSREESYSYEFKPSINKYVSPLTGKIGKYSSSCPNGVICLKNVYDIDVNAIPKTNNRNYYVFTKLGENSGQSNSLYNKLGKDSLTRSCTYGIYNDVIKCSNSDCDESSLKVLFRIVDSNNLDPNERFINKANNSIISYDGANGFKNWRDEKGKTVKTAIENSDTFSPENLEYSFILDSATIKKIRDYNSNCDVTGHCDPIKYSDTEHNGSRLKCDSEGNKCTSEFIDEAMKNSSPVLKTSKFALVTNGRNTWKEYKVTDGKYYIDDEKIR